MQSWKWALGIGLCIFLWLICVDIIALKVQTDKQGVMIKKKIVKLQIQIDQIIYSQKAIPEHKKWGKK